MQDTEHIQTARQKPLPKKGRGICEPSETSKKSLKFLCEKISNQRTMSRIITSPAGKMALIRPDFTNDPAGNNGKAGKIVSYFPEKQLAVIRLKDRSQPVYSADKLLVLKSPKWLIKVLLSGLLDSDTCRVVLQVYKLVKSKRPRKALLLAYRHEKAKFYCVEGCKDWIVRHSGS